MSASDSDSDSDAESDADGSPPNPALVAHHKNKRQSPLAAPAAPTLKPLAKDGSPKPVPPPIPPKPKFIGGRPTSQIDKVIYIPKWRS